MVTKIDENSKSEFRTGTLPLVLLAGERVAVIAGGGKIAFRKMKNLLMSNMKVKIVSPKVSDYFSEYFDQDNIEIIKREIKEGDIKNAFIVVAATDKKSKNREIISWAKKRNVLSLSVDSNWSKGDFIFPATYRDDELLFSVSTNGKACRRSRLVKNSIARHIETIRSADLYSLCIDHTRLDISKREKYSLTLENLELLGSLLMQVWGIHEFIILNTCNRLEFWALVDEHLNFEPLVMKLFGFDKLTEKQYLKHLGFEAFTHTSVLAAGIKSQLKGEYHIVAQIKDAFTFATKKGWANGAMKEWLDSSLHLSKKIRNQSVKPVSNSIAKIAVSYASLNFSETPYKIAIVGTGDVGSDILSIVKNRFPKAVITIGYHQKIPENSFKHIKILNQKNIEQIIRGNDLIFVAVTVAKPLFHNELIKKFTTIKKLIIDCSVPRAVEMADHNNKIKVVDMDMLNQWNREKIDSEIDIDKIEEIVRNERNLYEKIVKSFKDRNEVEQLSIDTE